LLFPASRVRILRWERIFKEEGRTAWRETAEWVRPLPHPPVKGELCPDCISASTLSLISCLPRRKSRHVLILGSRMAVVLQGLHRRSHALVPCAPAGSVQIVARRGGLACSCRQAGENDQLAGTRGTGARENENESLVWQRALPFSLFTSKLTRRPRPRPAQTILSSPPHTPPHPSVSAASRSP
jgi:hypothetical protein